MNARVIPPANSSHESAPQAMPPIPIHRLWKVKQGRQLKGFLSNTLCSWGKTIGRCFPPAMAAAVMVPMANNIIIVFMFIDKWGLKLLDHMPTHWSTCTI